MLFFLSACVPTTTRDGNTEIGAEIKKREEKGMNTYGVSTDRTDLTTEEWLQHLQEL